MKAFRRTLDRFWMQPHDTPQPGETTPPLAWPWALASPPATSSEGSAWRSALLRSWRGTSPAMEQPPLDHHYVAMHLGGAKRVTRRRDGPMVSTAVDCDSLTLVPAGTAYAWQTEGPIAFAHLYIPPEFLQHLVAQHFEADARGLTLVARVGCRDRFLEPLLARMIDEVGRGSDASVLHLDCLLESFCLRLAQQHTSHPSGSDTRVLRLAPHRLRRVLEFIDANFDRDISLGDLAAAAGSSQAHFSRAFHFATGCSPYRYLLLQRVAYAKVLLLTSAEPLDRIASRCGFNRAHQFGLAFKHLVGIGPKRYRGAPTAGAKWSRGG